jgi:hypothetical protein
MLLNDKRKHGLETEYITPMQAKSKDRLARNQDNVSEWDDMSIR